MGESYAIQGTGDSFIYNLWEMKEPNYVMRKMASGGILLENDTYKGTVRKWNKNGEDVVKKFKYELLFDYYLRYRHAVDNYYNIRNALSSIEDKWKTYWWWCRVFAFILTISEVN